MSNLIEDFEEVFEHELITPRLKKFNMENNITFGGEDGDLFSLNSPSVITENSIEIVNRLVLTPEMVEDFINSTYKGTIFFRQVKEDMKDLGCNTYTFKRPDGSSFMTLRETDNNLELRAYGYKENK